jgi:hypothetical protein
MPLVEVDEDQLKALRAGYGLLDGLLKNPKTRVEQEKLLKTIKPDVQTQGDILEPVMNQMKDLEKKFGDYVDGVNNRAADDALNAAFSRLRKDHHYTEEGLEKIKQLMVERKIPDPDAAAALWERMNPVPAQPANGYLGTGWNFGQDNGDAELKLLFGDPDAWADQEIGKVLNEIRSEGT